MSNQGDADNGMLAYITVDETHYLGGMTLALRAENDMEAIDMATAIAKIYNANIVKLCNGDYLVIKK